MTLFEPTISERVALRALGQFLQLVLPADTPIVVGQVNRVVEPKAPNFAIMWPLLRKRLRTNEDTFSDVAFTGSILDDVMTVTDVQLGVITVGAPVLGSGAIVTGTEITGLGSGSGGTGTYFVSPSQTAFEQQLASGVMSVEQGTQLTVQLDVHGPSGGDYAQTIATLLWDNYAMQAFEDQGLGVVPLYASDPKQLPFFNAEKRYEDRWVIEVQLQINPVVVVPQAAADQLAVTTIEVDAVYPVS